MSLWALNDVCREKTKAAFVNAVTNSATSNDDARGFHQLEIAMMFFFSFGWPTSGSHRFCFN